MGTEDIGDIGIDLTLPFKNPKWTSRYKEIEDYYNDNRSRIKRIYAHSLASNLITHINNNNPYMQKHTKITTYNNPITGQTPIQTNLKDLSNDADIVSIMDTHAKRFTGTMNPYKAHFSYEPEQQGKK